MLNRNNDQNYDENIAGKELLLHAKRKKICEKYNIKLSFPKQTQRIKSLSVLLVEYLGKSAPIPFLKNQIIGYLNQMIDCTAQQIIDIKKVDDLKFPKDILKNTINNIVWRNSLKMERWNKDVDKSKSLLLAAEGHISSESCKQELMKLKEETWDCFQKMLDINHELRNCIIGQQNKETAYNSACNFVDYMVFLDDQLDIAFSKIQDLKVESVEFFYDILCQYNIPANKYSDFQLFLQKKIESKLSDSAILKTSLGHAYEQDTKQLESVFEELKSRGEVDKTTINKLSNHYKKMLLSQQISFSQDIDECSEYLKNVFKNKADMLWDKMSHHKNTMDIYEEINIFDKKDFKEIEEAKLRKFVDNEKKIISSHVQALEDNFFKAMQLIKNRFVFEGNEATEEQLELIDFKNQSMDFIIKKFQARRDMEQEAFDNKIYLLNQEQDFTESNFTKIIKDLQLGCERICKELHQLNREFWIKANGEFNAEIRKNLIMWRYRNIPWIKVSSSPESPWMQNYLRCNLSSVYLELIGKSMSGLSPESDLYIQTSRALLNYNEKNRNLFKTRDLVEFEQLIALNTIPVVNIQEIDQMLEMKLQNLKQKEEELQFLMSKFN